MKLAIGIYYEYSHNGVDAGRCSRARSAVLAVAVPEVALAASEADVCCFERNRLARCRGKRLHSL